MSLNYTLDAGARLRVELVDESLMMLNAGYFALGQNYSYATKSPITGLTTMESFVLNSLDIQQGDGDNASISLSFLDYSFNSLKNNLTPQTYRAANGFSYARNVAKKNGLKFVGEEVKGKQQSIAIKAKNNTDSVWSVLQRSASDNQFMCFIADGTLFFASPKYLIGKWGIDVIQYKPSGESKEKPFSYIPLVYPVPEKETRYFLTEIPQVRKSLDSKKEAEGSATIFGESARYLRAGMTVMIYGMGQQFSMPYLITSVDFEENSVEPVQINFATVSKLAPEDKAKIDQKISEITVISGTGK